MRMTTQERAIIDPCRFEDLKRPLVFTLQNLETVNTLHDYISATLHHAQVHFHSPNFFRKIHLFQTLT